MEQNNNIPEGQFDTTDVSQDNIDNIWYQAQDKASDYADDNNLKLGVVGSGIMAKSFSMNNEPREINLIEFQNISVSDLATGENHLLGAILPEEVHLFEMKTPEKIYSEMKDMIDSFVEAKTNGELTELDSSTERLSATLQGNDSDIDITGDVDALKIDDKGYVSIDGFPVKFKGTDVQIDIDSTDNVNVKSSGPNVIITMDNTDGTSGTYYVDREMFNTKKGYYKLHKGEPDE